MTRFMVRVLCWGKPVINSGILKAFIFLFEIRNLKMLNFCSHFVDTALKPSGSLVGVA